MDIEFVRSQFPALQREFTFMDNAGGSQTLKKVAERISGYLLHHNVQLGASYKVSREAGEKLTYATKQVSRFINAGKPEEVVIGSSSSMLLRILSICISKQWEEGDEVIVTNTDHEANVSPWTDLKEKGINVKIWKANPDTLELEISDLNKLLSNRTKLVAVTHASNILGSINPIKEIAKTVHKAGALICVDGVAYAPHRRVDVRKLDVDFYVFSWYKTYGPHLAVMYGKYNQLYKMEGFNHYFFTKKDVPYKFQPGNFNFELTYSLLGITEYFDHLFKHEFPKEKKAEFQEKMDKVFELIGRHEERISKPLLTYLDEHPDIKIIGRNIAEREKRVPTISFVHTELSSDQIVEKVDDYRIGIRFGDFYAKKLIEDAGLKEKNGVVRVSLVHYNTLDEVQRLIWILKKIL
ncbi:aminotransferase [Salegentibacter salinarum]|uniref:Aminotransferase n=1 Tax=Salegentibacter salinarum TaxID=447422 RepID=A0A2N0U3A5_9FLAO|nr:cysteine desulfurase-like protein [Salegentibacter salinarum]PKD21492.1 aminotransferase [Salegentibacter salinarum]SKB37719.1 cysteine desulfurase family protein, VC1184 subfamily [Salegentibacter salinarum]